MARITEDGSVIPRYGAHDTQGDSVLPPGTLVTVAMRDWSHRGLGTIVATVPGDSVRGGFDHLILWSRVPWAWHDQPGHSRGQLSWFKRNEITSLRPV